MSENKNKETAEEMLRHIYDYINASLSLINSCTRISYFMNKLSEEERKKISMKLQKNIKSILLKELSHHIKKYK